jgi:predicted ATPase/class 3 adenylate cyclase
MDDLFSVYIPMDRRQAMARGEDLPDRTSGAALFADISGFTPLTEALVKALGPGHAAQEIIRQLNRVYEPLISEVHRYRGSVIGFVGDAITCWFDTGPELVDEQAGLRATACGIAMQQVMKSFATIDLQPVGTISLAIKVAIATGPARRFLVGDPQIQYIDTLAGTTVQQMAATEKQAQKGEVILAPETAARFEDKVAVTEWRLKAETGEQFAVVAKLHELVESRPWPPLPPATFNEDLVRPWLLKPVYERLIAGQGHFQAEMRPVVALFLKFGELDYDSDESAGQKLNDYVRWVQRVLARYEGHLIQLTIGDKGSYIYAAFGAPLAHDDDPDRAVAAALDLQALSLVSTVGRDVQIGLTRGQMRTGAYGSQRRQTYGVISNEVNLAARLMMKAVPGQILVSQDVADGLNQTYHLEYLGALKVKGKAVPMDVAMVLERRQLGAQKPLHLYDHPLVGREYELARLEQILVQAVEGEGQLVRMTGVAGIGKSHLASTFADRALHLGWRVVTGYCQSTSQNIPYHPWSQIFRALFVLVDDPGEDPTILASQHIAQVKRIVGGLNPDWLIRLPLLGDLLGLPIPDNTTTAIFDPRLRQEALHTLAVELIQSWAKDQPLLLLLEDVHWLDEASQGLLLALARFITQTPVVLMIVHRPSPADDLDILPNLDRLANYHQLDLKELSPAGMADLVVRRLQGQPAALLLDLIQVQAKGNPFYIEQLVDELRDTSHLAQQPNGQWTLSEPIMTQLRAAHRLTRDDAGQLILNPALPLDITDLGLSGSLHGLVLSRLDHLPEEHKLTLKVASVIGRVFDVELLGQAHPVELNEDELREQLGFVTGYEFIRLEQPPPQLSYIFRHDITREVIYETLLEEQQRRLHLAVAEAAETLQPEAVEQLAHHYSQAGVRDKSMIYLGRAARKTQREYANETALHYYAQALTLEERWDWRKQQVEVLHILGRREEEQASLEQLETNPAAPVFEVACLWGRYYEATANYPDAQAAIERALAASREKGAVVNEARALAQLGLIARQPGDYERAKDWYHQALALFEDKEHHTDEESKVLIDASNGLGTIYRQQGKFDQAKTYYQRALTLSRQHSNPSGEAEALNSLGVTTFYQRNLAEALIYFQQALEIRRTIGDRTGEEKSLYSLSFAFRDKGDYGQAQECLLAALTISQATGSYWDEINIWNDMGIVYQELGDLTRAQTCFQRGLTLAREIGDEVGLVYLQCNLSLVLRDQGDLTVAEQLLTDGLNLFQRENNKYEISTFLSYLSTVSLQAGRFEETMERANNALTLRQELDMRLNTTDDLATLAAAHMAIDNVAEALQYAEQALSILEECGGEGPEFPQRDYFICYQVLAARGQQERAQTALQAAYNLVMARAEKISDLALRQSFLERVAINQEIMAEASRVLAGGRGMEEQEGEVTEVEP